MTQEEIFAILQGNNPGGIQFPAGTNKPEQENAHSNIDEAINQNENKDYFDLIKGFSNVALPAVPFANLPSLIGNLKDIMPSKATMDKVENFVPPFGAIKLAQLASHAHNAPAHETNAFLTGLKEAILGEPDPVGPQGIPFSQFMQQKKALNPKVKSIVNQHVDNLFKK